MIISQAYDNFSCVNDDDGGDDDEMSVLWVYNYDVGKITLIYCLIAYPLANDNQVSILICYLLFSFPLYTQITYTYN